MQSGIVEWALEKAREIRDVPEVDHLLFSELDQQVVDRFIELCRQNPIYREADLIDLDLIETAVDYLARKHVQALRYDSRHFCAMLTCTLELAHPSTVESEKSAIFLSWVKAAADESVDRYRRLRRKGRPVRIDLASPDQ